MLYLAIVLNNIPYKCLSKPENFSPLVYIKIYSSLWKLHYLVIIAFFIWCIWYNAGIDYCMGPIEETKSHIAYFQDDLKTLQDLFEQSGFNKDNSMLSDSQIKEKNEYLEQMKDSKAAVKHHIANLNRLLSEPSNAAESSSSQSLGKRDISEVSENIVNSNLKRR